MKLIACSECDRVGTKAVTRHAFVREYQLAQMTLNVIKNNPKVDDQTRARVIQKELEPLRAKGIRADLANS